MATGGYNASYDESTPTGFGSENVDDIHNPDRGGVSSAPIVGIDLKRFAKIETLKGMHIPCCNIATEMKTLRRCWTVIKTVRSLMP